MPISLPVVKDQAAKVVVKKILDNPISALQVVRLTSGTTVDLADKSTFDDSLAFGFTLTAGAAGQEVEILTFGILDDPFFAYPLHDIIFLNTSGTITNVAPTSGFSVQLGQSLGAGSIYINIERPIEL